MRMSETRDAPTARVIVQGRALVRAIEALGTIDTTGSFERGIANLLVAGVGRVSIGSGS